MEQKKKSRLLLAAWVLGVAGLVIWMIGWFAPMAVDKVTGEGFSLFSIISGSISTYGLSGSTVALLCAIMIMIMFLSLPAAITLNLLGWRKNDAKKTLVAGILYIISLTIPSAVLCFIGRAQLKKKGV
jgi:hypothetical protein